MLSLKSSAIKALALSLLLSTGSFAQGTTSDSTDAQPKSSQDAGEANSGVGQRVTDPKQVDKGQNMILPSAGNAGPSAAPTMVYDCEKKPQDCTEPATPADKAGASENKAIKP